VVVVATMLPLTIVVVTLSILNLEHVVFDLMGGISLGQRERREGRSIGRCRRCAFRVRP
jgi:hypothetical protein